MTQVVDRAARTAAGPPSAVSRGDKPGEPPRQAPVAGGGVLLVAAVALIGAACLPLARVYVGLGFFRPVAAAALLAIGLGWAAWRMNLGVTLAAVTSAAGWLLFVSLAFLADTLAGGIVPTSESLSALGDLWGHGLRLIRSRPTPVLAEPGLLLLTVTGVWVVAHTVHAILVRLHAPLHATVVALVLWAVPLALTPGAGRAWLWALPLLAAFLAALLMTAHTDLRRWGMWFEVREGGSHLQQAAPSGGVAGTVALIAGVLLAGVLPGMNDPPWYQVSGAGGTTLTENPIVSIRPSLVSQSNEPLLRTRTPHATYLRVTGLDVYTELEEWTNSGIRSRQMSGALPFERSIAAYDTFEVTVTIESLPDAVLVPAPYQALTVSGPAADRLQYDPLLSTFTIRRGSSFEPGDEYTVTVGVPAPPAGEDVLLAPPEQALVALPPNVPESVAELARQIVNEAGAVTPYQQALAIQSELRTWAYEIDVPPGHSGRAMETFITNRIGYCEQFAGTMAVMLRSLGIPARVAVGFTPGHVRPTDEEGIFEYTVTPAHAHAWVEVLSRDYGWLAFEPTPRGDRDVLVPSIADPAPRETLREAEQRQSPAQPDENDFPQPVGGETAPEPPSPPAGPAPDAPGSGRGSGLVVIAALVLAATGLAAWKGLTSRSSRGSAHVPGVSPADRVLRAWARIQRLGRGLGVTPLPSETEREYIRRLAADAPAAASTGTVVAAGVAAVRYAPSLDPAAAHEAESAAEGLLQSLQSDMRRTQQLRTMVRGWVSERTEWTAARLRKLVSTSR